MPGNKFPWDYANPFIIDISVSDADLDSYKHVNNVVYMRWIDDCARAHSKAVGIDCDEAPEFGLGMAVRESKITYLSSAYAADKLLVGDWIVSNDQKLRITRQFQIIRESDHKTLLRATLEYICINISTGKATRQPPLFRELYVPVLMPGR